jgi:hypothetical protein
MNVNLELQNALSNATKINEYLVKVDEYFDYLSKNPPVLDVKEKATELEAQFPSFYEQVQDVLAYAKALGDYVHSVNICLGSIAPNPLDALASLSIVSDKD